MIFFNDIVFDTLQFIQFISRTPKLKTLERATVIFAANAVQLNLSSRTTGKGLPNVRISCKRFDWQISSLEQICTPSCPPISTLEDLNIHKLSFPPLDWQVDVEDAVWLDLLHPFIAVKNLFLSERISRCIVPSLHELIGGRTAEVLPSLQNIFLEGLQPSEPVQEGIKQFVATRQSTGYSIQFLVGTETGQRSRRLAIDESPPPSLITITFCVIYLPTPIPSFSLFLVIIVI